MEKPPVVSKASAFDSICIGHCCLTTASPLQSGELSLKRNINLAKTQCRQSMNSERVTFSIWTNQVPAPIVSAESPN